MVSRALPSSIRYLASQAKQYCSWLRARAVHGALNVPEENIDRCRQHPLLAVAEEAPPTESDRQQQGPFAPESSLCHHSAAVSRADECTASCPIYKSFQRWLPIPTLVLIKN